jgi:hypothetical protein
MASNGAVFTWTFDQAFTPVTAPPADETSVSRRGAIQTTTARVGTDEYEVA